jgi:hypothetical protein
MTSSFHFPITVVTNLLIALYWKDSIDASEIGNSGILGRMKIPFILASSLIVTCEVVTSSLRAAEVSSASVALTFAGVIYVIISVSTGVFFVVIGIMIIRRIKGSLQLTKGHSSVKASLRRVRMFRKIASPSFPLFTYILCHPDHYPRHVNCDFQLDFRCGHDSSCER